MERYDYYKESGVEWIGEIAEHWEVKRLKQVVGIINGSTPKSSIAEYWDGDVIWVTPAEISDKIKHLDTSVRKITQSGYLSCGTDLVPEGSVILTSRAPIGNVAIAGTELCTNQGCKSLVPNKNIESGYLYYQLIISKELLNSLGQGTTFLELSKSNLANVAFAYPGSAEQKAIVLYLDDHTQKLDRLIKNKKKQIARLKELRQIEINKAVTKGLNPDVELKNSGVEWIGEIPEHWEVKRLKNISPKIGVGLVINPSTYFEDGGTIPMLTGKNVLANKIIPGSANKISERSNEILSSTKIYENDIVTVRVGFPGTSAVVPKELDGCNCASMVIIRKGKFNSHFISLCFNSDIGNAQVDQVVYGAAQKQFNLSHAIEFLFPFPPTEEQDKIVEYLQKILLKIDQAITNLEAQINQLQEVRKIEIFNAVTGKVKVPARYFEQQEVEQLV